MMVRRTLPDWIQNQEQNVLVLSMRNQTISHKREEDFNNLSDTTKTILLRAVEEGTPIECTEQVFKEVGVDGITVPYNGFWFLVAVTSENAYCL
jgi:hypothetical protein